ncbi:MAG: phenylalanine--tRNA ligase subunit beta [Succinivibrio sp.]|nr:phenylalanine--tRNA ligase subunit beta [Succinivibrio sp.]
MRVNKNWIDEWVDSGLSTQELCDRITMAGLEVDTFEPVCGDFSKVVVGEVLDCVEHPDSDHMHVTKVNVGTGEELQIVCGAPNVRKGLKVCASVVGAHVGDLSIKPAKLRGVESYGMLCSYRELGMAEESDGIVELPDDAPVGMDIHEYMKLNDEAIEIDLTANRPDCLGVIGIAREVSVLTGKPLKSDTVAPVSAALDNVFPVEVQSPADCPRYLDRVIRGVNQKAKSPLWMTERLRRCGIRPVSPVVDVTNYVMLEFGQPLHSFDLNKLKDKIVVRRAKSDEKLTVLSGEEIALKDNTLIIADNSGPIALAGIFGGMNSGISEDTVDVLLESAFFAPDSIKGRARQYGLDTDASHRFERGVDPENQRRAIERATQLLLEIAGGKAGPVNEVVNEDYLPKHDSITLRYSKLEKVLGEKIPDDTVFAILDRLGMKPVRVEGGLTAHSPCFRFDIAIEEDLIEEVGRIYGYDRIPNATPVSELYMVHPSEKEVLDSMIRKALVNCGYNEAITYSFTDPKVLGEFSKIKPLMLTAPISPELSAMRTSLLAGLALAAKYNLNRQQKRVRLFEQGLRYIVDKDAENGVRQEAMVAGLAVGEVYAESWSVKNHSVDFFDIKGDLEQLLEVTCEAGRFEFKRSTNEALHPGQSADIYVSGRKVGFVGMLHPLTQKSLGFKQAVGVFEIERAAIAERAVPVYQPISKFPSSRRDFAFVLPKSVEVSKLLELVRAECGQKVQELRIFDVFEDESLGSNRSIALGVILQDPDRTLEIAEVDTLAEKIIKSAEEKLGATLRS